MIGTDSKNGTSAGTRFPGYGQNIGSTKARKKREWRIQSPRYQFQCQSEKEHLRPPYVISDPAPLAVAYRVRVLLKQTKILIMYMYRIL